VFDQRHLEFRLFERHAIGVLRRTLAEIRDSATVDTDNHTLSIDGHEIAVVYFRAGYQPPDYPSEREWEARLLLERSLAIKCPNVAFHLAGCKKIQQILADRAVLARFLPESDIGPVLESFIGLYSLGGGHHALDQAAVDKALANPSSYVLKPQREGGGNNIYDEAVRTELTRMSKEELSGFILMEMIQSPKRDTVFVRDDETSTGPALSELGVFGVMLSDGDVLNTNTEVGYLLRTKTSDSREGGVAAGFAVLDSVKLV